MCIYGYNMEVFCKALPKVELHAHLNGSLSGDILKKLGCTNELVEEHHKLNKSLPTDKTLNECFQLFKIAHDATNNAESVYLATKYVIEEFRNDNIIYLELRTTPRSENNMSKRQYIQAVIKAILESENIIVKLLLSLDRRHDLHTSEAVLNIILEMKDKYPNIIRGIDLSGNPYEGNFYKPLFEKARENGLFISLHCAEIKNDEEVLKMLHFKPDRIGHGTCLHPDFGGCQQIWDLHCSLKIPIECCLTSNVICGTTSCYSKHHLKALIDNCQPFSLCTDDKSVFSTSLSQEYIYASEYFNLSEKQLLNVVLESISHSFAACSEKEELVKQIEEWSTIHVKHHSSF